MKTLLAASVLALALAACGQSGGTTAPTATSAPSAEASVAPSAAAETTSVTVLDFTLDPKDVTVEGTVSLAVTNDGPTVHNVAIRDGSDAVVGTTTDLKTGESETLTVDLPAGTYTLFCSLPGHESLGITGTLTVN